MWGMGVIGLIVLEGFELGMLVEPLVPAFEQRG